MTKRSFRHWRIVRFVVGRRRLLLSFAAGLMLFAVLPDRLYPATRFIFAWDLMTALYVGATLIMMAQSTVETCHNRAALYDEGDWVILVLVVASAAASFVAIFAELASLTGKREPLALGIAITAMTVALSWTFTHVVFTLHYANVYYKPDDDGPGGLHFPGNRAPDYRDFLYYSFVIGCACPDRRCRDHFARHASSHPGARRRGLRLQHRHPRADDQCRRQPAPLSPAMPVRSRLVDIVGLVLFLALCLGVGALGASVTATSVENWYAGLVKPSFNPPDEVFGPVWTVLYILMGVAAWRVWRSADRDTARGPLTLFALQLAINLGWTVVFFGLQKIASAVATIVVLDVAVLVTMLAFRSRRSAWRRC